VSLEPIAAPDLPELLEFFERIGVHFGAGNLQQFSRPGGYPGGVGITTLALRDDGRIQGTIGWIDVPALVRGSAVMLRWPINQYLAAECRGRGLGKALMEATRPGTALRCVIGGNSASIPILDRTGYIQMGNLQRFRWSRPCLAPRLVGDRLAAGPRSLPPEELGFTRGGRRVTARRAPALDPPDLPWQRSAPPGGIQVPRTQGYLRWAFGGPLQSWHLVYQVVIEGSLSGCFVLAARAERRFVLTTEIVDLDCAAGAEEETLDAALRVALSRADVARLRVCGGRLVRAAASAGGRKESDHPVRLSCDASLMGELRDLDAWQLTYGDHDQFRVRASSRIWRR